MPFSSAILVSLLIFSGAAAKIKWRPRGRDLASSQTLCPSYPYPSVDPQTLLEHLALYLDVWGRNMSALVNSTPGGAFVSLVYRDTVIWSLGAGVVNMSGKNYSKGTSILRLIIYLYNINTILYYILGIIVVS